METIQRFKYKKYTNNFKKKRATYRPLTSLTRKILA